MHFTRSDRYVYNKKRERQQTSRGWMQFFFGRLDPLGCARPYYARAGPTKRNAEQRPFYWLLANVDASTTFQKSSISLYN